VHKKPFRVNVINYIIRINIQVTTKLVFSHSWRISRIITSIKMLFQFRKHRLDPLIDKAQALVRTRFTEIFSIYSMH